MDSLGWLWWGLVKVLEFVLSLTWFLLGGWLSTLVQLVLVVGVLFALRYGWRRAPAEMWNRASKLLSFGWAWARHRDPRAVDRPRTDPWARTSRTPAPAPSSPRTFRRRRRGDVSLSTLLTLALLVGLIAVGAL